MRVHTQHTHTRSLGHAHFMIGRKTAKEQDSVCTMWRDCEGCQDASVPTHNNMENNETMKHGMRGKQRMLQRAHSLFIYLCWIHSVCTCTLASFFHRILSTSDRCSECIWVQRTSVILAAGATAPEHIIYFWFPSKLRTLKMQFRQLHQRNSNRILNTWRGMPYMYQFPSTSFRPRWSWRRWERKKPSEFKWKTNYYRQFRTAGMVARC